MTKLIFLLSLLKSKLEASKITQSMSTQLQTEFADALEFLAPENAVVDGAAPQTFVAPRDEDAARALMQFCGREKLAIIPLGNATKIGIGAPPTRFDVAISTRHLNQIFDHDAGNATIEVGAGISLSELNAAVADAKQFVPLDDDGGTLGGVVACNSFGPSKLKWGAPRDLVVGLHAMLSDGRHVKGGAKVVKNVAGYDLPKLFVGSFGSLGLISRVTIRLRANDAATARWCEGFASLKELEMRAAEILNGPFEPTVLRALWRGQSWQLHAKFDGGQGAVAAQLERLPATAEFNDLPSPKLNWQLRAQLPITRAAGWLRAARNDGATTLDWDAGLGIARADFADCSPQIVARLRALCGESGGWLRVEKAPLEQKTPDLIWGATRADAPLMRGLKVAYDAANVCAPGRFVGGI